MEGRDPLRPPGEPDIRVDDVVQCCNPESHRCGQYGVVEAVCLKPIWERNKVGGREERVCVSGSEMNAGESFADVRYPDGIRGQHDLAMLQVEEE